MSNPRATDLRLVDATDRVCELAAKLRTAAMLDGIEALERVADELNNAIGEVALRLGQLHPGEVEEDERWAL